MMGNPARSILERIQAFIEREYMPILSLQQLAGPLRLLHDRSAVGGQHHGVFLRHFRLDER